MEFVPQITRATSGLRLFGSEFGRGLVLVFLALVASGASADVTVERVTTTVPFPRGLATADLDGDGADELYVLSRGRVRDSGGVSGDVDDRAGTLWRVDAGTGETGVFAEPSDPPFKLFDRAADPPSSDRRADRPYCGLRWHAPTRSFYVCAFSGIDLAESDPAKAEYGSFSKNYTDAVLRYDTRTGRWSEVDRHDPQYGADYPGGDGRGWLKGPDNLAAVGDGTMIVAAKDNSRLVAFDVSPLNDDPDAELPTPRVVLGETVRLANRDGEERTVLGHSAVGYRDGWLYVGFRTTGEVIRVPVGRDGAGRVTLDADGAELLAQFQPWVPAERKSANLTDLSIGPDGDVYVVSAMPARVYRFAPDPLNVRDYASGFETGGGAWADLAAITGNPRMKSENVLAADDGSVYVTSGDAYGDARAAGLGGTVWRVNEVTPGR